MGKPSYRKRSLANDISPLPFPVASVSTLLFIVLGVSTLLALSIGASRNHHGVTLGAIDLPVAGPAAATAGGQTDANDVPSNSNQGDKNASGGPFIRSFRDLKEAELHPQAGPDRHIVSPPPDEMPATLVTCKTTAGYLHVMVHPSWAPLGANRFLQMVETKYFSSRVVSVA